MIPPERDFRRLKRAVSIEQVLAHRGLLHGLTVRGHQIVGPCPIHRGDNPRAFVVHRSRNVWRCFTGCDAGGDVVELVRRLDGGGYHDVAVYLASLDGHETPALPTVSMDPAARRFRPFRARLSLDHDSSMLRRKGIHPEIARRFEAGAYHGRGMLQGCVAVRLHDPDGRPLGYAGRRLDPSHIRQRGKWVFPPRLPKNGLLFGVHHLRPPLQRALVLVECPWGVMRLAQLGIPAVGLLGTHLSATQRSLLLDTAPKVIVMMDGDTTGRRATVHIRQALCAYLETSVVNLAEGLDPDDLDDAELWQIVGADLLF